MNKVHFSSNSNEWTTPQAFFDRLDAEFNFTLDAAATPDNAKCDQFFTEKQNAILQDWDGIVWLNPPYGRTLGRWVRKAWEESRRGSTVVMLIPARPDTSYWHDYVMKSAEVRFVRGRLKFGNAKAGAPFPCCVVVFRPYWTGWPMFSGMER